MASIKERTHQDGSKTYQVQIRRKGYPPISKNFESERKAKQWAIETEASVLKNETINPREATKWTIPEIIKWYKLNPSPARKLETKKHHQRLDLLSEEFKHFTALTLTPAILSKWVNKRLKINAPATVYHYYVALKNAMIHHAVQHNYSQNIFNMVKCPTKSGERDRVLTSKELANLFRAIKTQSRNKQQEMMLTVLFAINSACRITEMLLLKWSNVNLDERYIDFIKEDTKTKEMRRVPLTSTSTKILKWMKQHHYDKNLKDSEQRVFSMWHVNEHHLSRQFQICCHRAGIEDIRWHDLRHMGTTKLFEKTQLTDMEIALITGHKTMQMLKRYAHLRPSTIIHKLW